MDLKDRIQEYVTSLEDIPKTESKYQIDKDLQGAVFNIITSSKFRRTALDEKSKADLFKKIETAVNNNLPIEFSIPFGAYKSFKLKPYEYIYWAELFNIFYMMQYLLPISQIYKPGVIISYSYHRGIMHETNNISSDDLKEYQTVFNKLLEYYNNKLPENFRLRMQAINDLYANDQEWQDELKQLYKVNKENWMASNDESKKIKELTSARNNFAVRGEKDFSSSSAAEMDEKILHSAIMVNSIEDLSKRRPFNKSTHRIQLVFLRGPSLVVHVGVCEGSTNQFWVGLGSLEIRENRIIPKISPFSHIKEFHKVAVQSVFFEISEKFSHIYYEVV